MSDQAIQEAVRSIESNVRMRSGVGVSEVRRRTRMLRAWRASIAGVVLIVVLLGLRLVWGSDPYDGSEGVISPNLNIPVGVPVEDRPGGWIGVPAETPRFDTSTLGEPQLLDFRGAALPEDSPTGAWIESVYLGHLDGEAQYVFSVQAPSVFDRISEVLLGNPSGRSIGTTVYCCTSDNPDIGKPNSSRSQRGVGGAVVEDFTNLFWLGVPEETSVVAVSVGDEPVLWQSPVSNVFVARTDGALHEIIIRSGVTFIAFDAEGDVIESVFVGR